MLPGFIDMHNHLAYNALPLWAEPGRTEPWLHNKHWTQADTYTESITEPAWTYAKACPEALLGYVQVREMAGGATSAQGWPSSNRGYQTVMRNVDDERAGHQGKAGDDLIYTSVVTKTGDALVTAVRRMENGSGFIYHCAEGQKGSRVRRDFTDLQRADGLLPTLHRHPLLRPGAPVTGCNGSETEAGGVVWSPLSNLVLYRDTTLIDDARARGVRVCLGSDWGPSGTRNLLGEMKVARLAARHFGYSISDRDIVADGHLQPRRPPDAVLGAPDRTGSSRAASPTSPSCAGTARAMRGAGSLAATELHVELVVVGGVPRYGDRDLMARRGRTRQLPDDRPSPPQARGASRPGRHRPGRGRGQQIMGTLQHRAGRPAAAIANASARAVAGPRFAEDAALELFLDMPDTRRTGRAGPPKDPSSVRIPPVPPIEHDREYFDALDANPIQAGILARAEAGIRAVSQLLATRPSSPARATPAAGARRAGGTRPSLPSS